MDTTIVSDAAIRSPKITSDATYPTGNLPCIEVESVPACPVCGADSKSAFAAGYDYELETCGNRWQFVRCSNCDHIWLDPRPAISTLATIYPSNYYAYNYESTVNPIARWGKSVLDRRKLSGIVRSANRQVGSYLDIGCGSGRFLDAMAARGVANDHICGLELNEEVVRHLTERGYQAWCRRVEDCTEIPPASIDLATMFHVIEHVDNPRRVVDCVSQWLTPGGVFAIETPNLDSLDARIFRQTWWGGYHIPRHWNLFTPQSLRRLVESAGLEVIGLRFLPGHSFWCYSWHHRLKYGQRQHRALAKCFDPFRGLPALVTFTIWDLLRAFCGARTSSMLMLVRRKS